VVRGITVFWFLFFLGTQSVSAEASCFIQASFADQVYAQSDDSLAPDTLLLLCEEGTPSPQIYSLQISAKLEGKEEVFHLSFPWGGARYFSTNNETWVSLPGRVASFLRDEGPFYIFVEVVTSVGSFD
jgi:hypothetical protein